MSKEKDKQDKKAIWVPPEIHHEVKVEATKQRMTMWEYLRQLAVVFAAFCLLEWAWWMFGGYIVLMVATKENLVRRAHNAEDEVTRLESKVKACEIRITYLEDENETLREMARRSGSRVVDREETGKEWEEDKDADGEEDYHMNYNIRYK